MKHTIWSNIDLDYEDWRTDMEAYYPDMSEDERQEKMWEINADYLDDERMNLNIQLRTPIIVIADLGLWNGRHSGYKEIKSGNVSDCLYAEGDYTRWYVDSYRNLRCDDIHHDGTNHYLYRAWKDGISEHQKEDFESKIYHGTVTPKDISRYTRRLGDEIAKVYGW